MNKILNIIIHQSFDRLLFNIQKTGPILEGKWTSLENTAYQQKNSKYIYFFNLSKSREKNLKKFCSEMIYQKTTLVLLVDGYQLI